MDELNGAVARYRGQADEMEEFLSNCPAGAVVWPPGVGRWSILEIAAHLADAELLASARVRRIITQDRPEMRGYNGELSLRELIEDYITHTAKHLDQMRLAAGA